MLTAIVIVALVACVGWAIFERIRAHRLAQRTLASCTEEIRTLTELATHLQRVSEREKSALARELHDELGGLLVAIKMDLAQLKSKLDLGQPDVQKRWERIQGALSSGIDLKRRVIEQLRPSLLDNMGLTAALRWQACEICTAANLKLVERYPEQELNLSPDASIAIYRIAQEALMNIVMHARASQASVEVAADASELQLIIEDDGIGMDASRKDGTHGMHAMRHRLLPFGGRFTIENAEPSGARIRVSLPMARIVGTPAAS